MAADKIESVSISDIVVAVTEKAILLERLSVDAGQAEQRWIAKSLILDSDTDLDDIQVGDEITIVRSSSILQAQLLELLRWKTREPVYTGSPPSRLTFKFDPHVAVDWLRRA